MFLMDEATIGANIRRLRERGGCTVTQLAQAAQLSKATLSKIETGRISSPVSTLLRIADALDTPLAEFFLESDTQPPYVLTRAGQGRILSRDGSQFGYSYEALAPGLRRKHAEPFLLTIRPGDPVGEFRHGGQEFIYMLAGRLAFTVGADRLILRKGDALYFDPTLVHRTEVLGKTAARFLCLFLQDPAATPIKTRRGRRPA